MGNSVLEGQCVDIGSVLVMNASLRKTMPMVRDEGVSFDPSSQFSCESKLL